MTSVAIRLILDRAATVDEALDLMREYNFCANVKGKTNYHFLISDATGRSVVLEYIKTGEKWVMSVLEENHVTNFYLSEGWREIGGGQERYAKLEEGIGIMDSDKAMELLSKVYQDGSGPNHSRTQWSVVYNLTHGTMAVSILGQYDKIYRRD